MIEQYSTTGSSALAAELRQLFVEFAGRLPADQLKQLTRRDERRSTYARLNFRPRPHDGLPLSELARDEARAALRFFSAALSDRGFAVLCTTMATEDIIARSSGWSKDQHRGDYWIVSDEFSDNDVLLVKLEGHHVSVTVAVSSGGVYVSPVFLGAYPAKIATADGHCIVRPLAPAAIYAREIIDADPNALQGESTPSDLLVGGVEAFPSLDVGLPVCDFSETAQVAAMKLLDAYIGLASPAANPHHSGIRVDDLRFAWYGSIREDDDHYYVLHAGPRACIEYTNQKHADVTANHEHTVIRSGPFDFGGALLHGAVGDAQ